ncbi:hypothetical protein M9H77_30140 [Catharanthus roseus]|uniref:Uncharacterized protein n=1 Tax=Catharanthus roseus TaxID=4058 RepID=A0ACB9ZYN8_CATRO|nr:hypothetical protein M9H77_30140 [Catharanthus roseus]
MGAQPIKTWNLIKQSLRNRFGVGNHERQRQGQAKEKFMESSRGEIFTKADELSQVQDKFEAQNMENDRIHPQFLNFITTTCGTKSNNGMKLKKKAWERSLALALKTHH